MKFTKINKENIRHNLQNIHQVIFEVTNKCNLNCKYCAYSDLYQNFESREGKDMSFSVAKQIIDYLYDLWKEKYSVGSNRRIHISFYGGEPLLNVPLIKQIIDYLENLENIGLVYTYAMTTNAMLLDQYIDFLIKKNFRLLISLDGDEFAQSYRVDHSEKNSFSRVFYNVKMLQEKYPEYFIERVGFLSVLHNRNNFEDVFQFISKSFNKIPTISSIKNVGICEEKKDDYKKMFLNPTQSFFNSKNCNALEAKHTINTPRIARLANYIQYQSGNIFSSYNGLYSDNTSNIIPTGTCTPFSIKLYVAVNGKIFPCERVGSQFSIGQVYDNQVELDEEKVADIHNHYVLKYIKQCETCAIVRRCKSCVYQNDDLLKADARCMEFCSEKELEQKHEIIFQFLQSNPHYYKRIMEENLFEISIL